MLRKQSIWKGQTLTDKCIIWKRGLNMMRSCDMQAAFQIAWVKRLHEADEETWSAITRNEFSKLSGSLNVFKSTVVSVKSFKGFGLIQSKYWCDVLKPWLDKNSNNLEVTPCSVEDQNLWNNDDIKFKQNVLLFREWVNDGIYKLGHMFDDEGNFRTVNDIIEIVGNSAVRQFQYNAVYNAIPAEWRVKSGVNKVVNPTFLGTKNLFLLSTKEIRRQLTSFNYSQPCCVGFWSRKFSHDLNFRTWMISYSSTKETRLLVLHWKLLHNIYPTNIMLNKWLYVALKCVLLDVEKRIILNISFSFALQKEPLASCRECVTWCSWAYCVY